MKIFAATVLALFLIITACGGGGGGSSSGSSPISSSSPISGAVIKLAWDPSTDSNIAGYKVYYGTNAGNYENAVDVGNATAYTLSGLAAGQTYYISVTAYDTANNESGFSNEVSGNAA